MESNRALFWIGVVALIALGFVAGQPMAVAIAACVALFLIYEQLLKRSGSSAAPPSVHTS